jgi:large subunit ribosomal protein L23
MSAFWDKLKKDTDAPKQDGKKEPKKVKKAKAVKVDKEKAALFSRVLKFPVISENAMNQQTLNKYVFEVGTSANKREITQAIEAVYGVRVEGVNVICSKPTQRNFRMKQGMSKASKRAIITVAKDQQIELFKEA